MQLSTDESYLIATGAVCLFAAPSLGEAMRPRRALPWLGLAAGSVALAGVAWLARPWVPPATLWLTQTAVSTDFDARHRRPAGGDARLDTELRVAPAR